VAKYDGLTDYQKAGHGGAGASSGSAAAAASAPAHPMGRRDAMPHIKTFLRYELGSGGGGGGGRACQTLLATS